MRFRFTKSKGTMIFGVWLILVGLNQMMPDAIVNAKYILGLIVITAGVFLLFEF
jgi:hypothetical protein